MTSAGGINLREDCTRNFHRTAGNFKNLGVVTIDSHFTSERSERRERRMYGACNGGHYHIVFSVRADHPRVNHLPLFYLFVLPIYHVQHSRKNRRQDCQSKQRLLGVVLSLSNQTYRPA